MLNTHFTIQILPQKRTLSTVPGVSLMEALMRNGIFLKSDCGGKGSCGKCRVSILKADGSFEAVNSCQYEVDKDISIQIPETSIASAFIMDKAQVSFPTAFKKQINPPATGPLYVAAVDLGTTTIAVYLCDMAQRKVISSIALKNPQAIYGADVMSRIGVVSGEEKNLEKMQDLTIKGIEWGLKQLLSSVGDGVTLSKMVVVGNPTMIHILAGIDPTPMGISPYQPVFFDARVFQSDDLGFSNPSFQIQTLPNISGFLGGDILAAAQAAEMDSQPDGTLLIDLGTNGELLLKYKDSLYATSCATGPAFEGATLACGVQAIPGAINSIKIDQDQNMEDLSMVNPSGLSPIKPTGICGPGVINAVAQFCTTGVIKPDGGFSAGRDKYILVPENLTSGQPCIYIGQKDIRSVQLGKSALMTGIAFLLKKAGLDKPEKIIIAGAFGAYLTKSDLIRLGMIPKIAFDKIEIAGNLAGSGAVMAVCDTQYLQNAIDMKTKIETIDLSCDMGFQNAFIENLSFPEIY
jgi:uncharacterized 2Fe-2S/4Fe-4S cluster protein (DUF4445 family)